MKHDILVIEADEPLRWLLENVLKGKFNVSIATNSLSAMAWLSNGNLPAAILCDYDLPGMNGLNFLQRLKKSGAYGEIPVIIFSTNAEKSFVEECIKAGCSGFVKKPFDPIDLIESINKVLRENKTLV